MSNQSILDALSGDPPSDELLESLLNEIDVTPSLSLDEAEKAVEALETEQVKRDYYEGIYKVKREPAQKNAEPDQEVLRQDVKPTPSVKPQRKRRVKAKPELDTARMASDMTLRGFVDYLSSDNPSSLLGDRAYSILNALDQVKNQKRIERHANLLAWLAGRANLRIYTRYALQTLIDQGKNGISKKELEAVYVTFHELAAKTALSQRNHYWNVLRELSIAEEIDDRLYVIETSPFVTKFKSEPKP